MHIRIDDVGDMVVPTDNDDDMLVPVDAVEGILAL